MRSFGKSLQDGGVLFEDLFLVEGGIDPGGFRARFFPDPLGKFPSQVAVDGDLRAKPGQQRCRPGTKIPTRSGPTIIRVLVETWTKSFQRFNFLSLSFSAAARGFIPGCQGGQHLAEGEIGVGDAGLGVAFAHGGDQGGVGLFDPADEFGDQG